MLFVYMSCFNHSSIIIITSCSMPTMYLISFSKKRGCYVICLSIHLFLFVSNMRLNSYIETQHLMFVSSFQQTIILLPRADDSLLRKDTHVYSLYLEVNKTLSNTTLMLVNLLLLLRIYTNT